MIDDTKITTPFGVDSTAADVVAGIDLSGKRAIVKGAGSGSAWRPHERWPSRAGGDDGGPEDRRRRARRRRHRATTSNDKVTVAPLDLTDDASIAAFVTAWDGPLDILVNNAGVMATAMR